MGYKLSKFCENRERDTSLWGVHIPHFDQISVKISLLGVLCPALMGVKFGNLRAKFHPHRCNVSPLRGEKPQNQPPGNLNTGALCSAQCCRG